MKEKDKDFPFERVVSISGNSVIVKLSEDSQAEYKFFNDVQVVARPLNDKEYTIIIGSKVNEVKNG